MIFKRTIKYVHKEAARTETSSPRHCNQFHLLLDFKSGNTPTIARYLVSIQKPSHALR